MRALKSIVAVTAVIAGLIIPITSSQATGVVSMSPSTGTNTSALTLSASAPCSTEDANTKIQAFLSGPGFPAQGYSIFNKSAASMVKSGSGYTFPLLENMQSAAASQTPSATLGGKYTLTIKCYQGLSNTPTSTLGTTNFWFTSATAYVTADPATSTSVALQASASDVSNATEVTFTATMTPSNAVGSVEFFDGSASLGSVAVASGVATKAKTFSTDAAGAIKTHAITAVFTPTNALAFGPSTSSAANVKVTTPSGVGTVSASPAEGTSSSAININTTSLCPDAGVATKVQVVMEGAGFSGGKNVTPKAAEGSLARVSTGYQTTLSKNMVSFAAEQDPVPTLTGQYTFTVKCFEGVGSSPTAIIGSTSIWFSSPTAYRSTPPTATSVALGASASEVSNSTEVTFTATMTPSNAAGSVEFFDGVTSLGSVAVAAGVATKAKTFSTDGAGVIKTHAVTAVFTPTNAANFDASTSTAANVKVTTPPATGTVSVSPTDGTSNSAIDIYTTTMCPNADAATKVQVVMEGQGFSGGKNVTPKAAEGSLARSGSGYRTTLSKNMAAFAAEQNPVPTLSGQYTFTVKCFQGVGSSPTAIIGSSSLWFTSPTVYQTTEPASGVATSLEVAITPVGSVVAGSTVTFTATVTPSGATGSVLFTATPVSGGGSPITLGTGQIAQGVATVTYNSLAGGASSGLPKSYRIDASYTSNSDDYFDSEADQKTLVVLAKLTPVNTVAPVLSTAKVGTSLTCTRGTWLDASTYSIVISVAGTSVSTSTGTTASYTPVAADANKSVTCRVTATSVDGLTANQDATAKTVGLGSALTVVAGKSPKITGTIATGKKVTVSAGTWSPAATSYTYQWVTIVGTKATSISKATASSFTIPASLKGKTIGVIVTAKKAGYANGTITVKAGKIA
ncbi:MAG: hypothetical protein NT180_01365 [Actinobacteria bacterium]|nr:hypothetical protein [Actinomycetota bacterium]